MFYDPIMEEDAELAYLCPLVLVLVGVWTVCLWGLGSDSTSRQSPSFSPSDSPSGAETLLSQHLHNTSVLLLAFLTPSFPPHPPQHFNESQLPKLQ